MIAFTCSGTGGHIYPAIAVAQKIGHQKSIFIIEKDRLAASVIPKYGFNCAKINFKLKCLRRTGIIFFTRCPTNT